MLKTSNEIRNDFLRFFEERGHKIVPSAPVIPYDDPTLLFTNAGMNQFKDIFLGTGKRDYNRAADSQKCIRVSGKHNDLEEVGRDTYHHTFFEMLGNWSFGDYYKKEAIEWAWELMTIVWGLDKTRLYATVFETDDEAEQLWKKVTDINPSHVLRFGKKDNFWEMGETGPCGPCSEIHIDLSENGDCGHLVNAGDARVMEIWNLVFIQYNRDDKGTLTPLPAKHVDTGMGFERICAVLQGKKSNYDTDVFTPIIKHISNIVGKPYQSKLDDPLDIAMRVIADHVRMLSFSIAAGGIPSNEGRGYVMRRILRRGARFGRSLGMHEPFIFKIVEAVVQSMGDQYPEIKERQNHIERVIKGEEESFNATLDRGLEIFETVIEEIGHSKTFPGEDAFKLYDTYGFPLDLTELMATERGLKVDVGRFTELMEEQKERSRTNTKAEWMAGPSGFFVGDNYDKVVNEQEEKFKRTDFDYTNLIVETKADFPPLTYMPSEKKDLLRGIILKSTSFYVESGGQVSDKGTLEFILGNNEKIILNVYDVIRERSRTVHILEKLNPEGIIYHLLNNYISIRTEIDIPRRQNIMRNHTATHLLHEALRRVLGSHVQQHGSLVAPDRLRFDFNHFERVTEEQIREIENIVNKKISEGISVEAKEMPIEEAKKIPGIKMFFGEKYGDVVRVIRMADNFSAELCGGTHVKNTADIGLFKITSEASIASGIRRIEAITLGGSKTYINELKSKTEELYDKIGQLVAEKEKLEKETNSPVTVNVSRITDAKQIKLVSYKSVTANIFKSGNDTLDLIYHYESELSKADTIIAELNKSISELKKAAGKQRVEAASGNIDSLVAEASNLNGFKIVTAKVEASTMDELKNIGDTLRAKLISGVGVLAAVIDKKVAFVCIVTDDLIKNKKLHAGKIVGEIAKITGGSGGGRPHLATAGGKDVDKLDEALSKVPEIVKTLIN